MYRAETTNPPPGSRSCFCHNRGRLSRLLLRTSMHLRMAVCTRSGDGLYLHLVSSTNGSSLANLPVKGQLVKSCQPSSGNIQTLGTWNFQTNGTGFVSVPSSDLSGMGFWFTVTYGGSTYLAKSPVCGRRCDLCPVEPSRRKSYLGKRFRLPTLGLQSVRVPTAFKRQQAVTESTGKAMQQSPKTTRRETHV